MNPWVDALNDAGAGWAASLWRASWQGALAISAVWIFCRAFPRLPTGARCWLWRLAFAKLLLGLFWATPVRIPLLPAPRAAPAAMRNAPLPDARQAREWIRRDPESGRGTLPPPREPAVVLPSSVAWLFLLWLSGVGWQAACARREWRRAGRLRRSGSRIADAAAVAALRQLCRDMRAARPPALLESGECQSMLLLGTARPAILLPAGLLRECAPDELRLLLAHELAHLMRHDLWWGWLPAAARILFFFHPLVHPALAQSRLSEEMACDAAALELTSAPPAEYGRALLRAAERHSADLRLAAAGVGGSYQSLRERLSALRPPGEGIRRRPAMVGAMLLAGVLALVPWHVVAREAAEAPRAMEEGRIRSPVLPPLGAPQTLYVSGEVTGPGGRPVTGATVYVFDGLARWGLRAHPHADPAGRAEKLLATRKTGADGLYRFEPLRFQTLGSVLPAPAWQPLLRIVVLHPAYGPAGFAGRPSTNPRVYLRFTLPQATLWEGVVTDEAGQPLAGATARVAYVAAAYSATDPQAHFNLPDPLGQRFTAHTDRVGVFRIPGLPQGRSASLRVTAAGHAAYYGRAALANSARSGPTRVKLARAGGIRGRVTYEESGKPAPGVPVFARVHRIRDAVGILPGAAMAGAYVKTDAAGGFRLTGLAPVTWDVGVDLVEPAPSDRTAASLAVPLKAGESVTGIALKLTQGGMLVVHVLNARTGAPVPRAGVNAASSGRPGYAEFLQAQTDARGEAQFRLPAGHVRASVWLPDWHTDRPAMQETEVVADTTRTVSIELDPGAPILGVVIDEKGRPVGGAHIQRAHGLVLPIRWLSWDNVAVSNPRGVFEIRGFRARTQLRLRAVGPEGDTPEPQPARTGQRERVTLRMRAFDPGTLAGRVVGTDGKPIPGATMEAAAVLARGELMQMRLRLIRTDAGGRYVIPGIWGGKSYVVRAALYGSPRARYGTFQMSRRLRAVAGRTNRVPDLVLRRP